MRIFDLKKTAVHPKNFIRLEKKHVRTCKLLPVGNIGANLVDGDIGVSVKLWSNGLILAIKIDGWANLSYIERMMENRGAVLVFYAATRS